MRGSSQARAPANAVLFWLSPGSDRQRDTVEVVDPDNPAAVST
jgi:hypothetical protein